MDPTGCYTTQQQIKITEACFAAKSVLLTQWQCSKDFGRNNVPDGRTIQHLVPNFGRQELGQMPTKTNIIHFSA